MGIVQRNVRKFNWILFDKTRQKFQFFSRRAQRKISQGGKSSKVFKYFLLIYFMVVNFFRYPWHLHCKDLIRRNSQCISHLALACEKDKVYLTFLLLILFLKAGLIAKIHPLAIWKIITAVKWDICLKTTHTKEIPVITLQISNLTL